MEKKNQKIIKLSFEEAVAELESIVNSLENGQIPLDNAIELFMRGNELKAHCENKLKEAKMKVDQIKIKEDGTIQLEPLDVVG